MKCKKCKKEIDDDSLYCKWCGAAQKKDVKKKMYQRPDGLYEKILVLNGKRVPFRGKTESEVYKKISAYEEKQEVGRTFKEVAEGWKQQHFPTLSPTTVKGYEPALIRAIEYFGDTPIKRIEPKEIKLFVDGFAHKGYAQKTVANQMIILHMVFEYAGFEEGLESNPMTFVKMPKGLSKTRRELPSDEDIKAVKSNVDLPFGLFAYFILYTGCRRGEALAIQYNDIDYVKKVIHITKSVIYSGNTPQIKTPKTQSGFRDIILLDILADKLPKGKDEDFLFGDGSEPMHSSKFDRRWKKYTNLSGVTCTPHQLRHAYATMLYEAGINRKDAQELMGHSDISVTENIYTHISNAQRKATTQRLNEFTKNTQ